MQRGGKRDGDVRKRGNRLAECGIVLCGEYLSTCRRVLECFPQGALAGSARRCGTSGDGRGWQAPKQAVPGGALLRACRWRGGVRIVDSVSAGCRRVGGPCLADGGRRGRTGGYSFPSAGADGLPPLCGFLTRARRKSRHSRSVAEPLNHASAV